MTGVLGYFKWSFVVTILGVALAAWLGWQTIGTIGGAASFLLIGLVLAVLEISLSFDNAIVNANKLKDMTPVWQQRFLTWGIIIAVFGMRIVFPLLVVVIAARIGPVDAVILAAREPQEYARIIGDAHLSISAFGGSFLMLVALNYFMDQEKEVDWLRIVESRMRACASVKGLEVAVVLTVAVIFTVLLPAGDGAVFLFASVCGVLTFLGVELIGHMLDAQEEAASAIAKGGFGAFLYLEVLDASFSFDGVIGAFALTQNLFLIAIGLGIGAMYVRSMTLMLVERRTLAQFRYLEHGAFYSVLMLAVIMFAQSLVHIPEVVTGLIGAGLIGLSLVASIRHEHFAEGH